MSFHSHKWLCQQVVRAPSVPRVCSSFLLLLCLEFLHRIFPHLCFRLSEILFVGHFLRAGPSAHVEELIIQGAGEGGHCQLRGQGRLLGGRGSNEDLRAQEWSLGRASGEGHHLGQLPCENAHPWGTPGKVEGAWEFEERGSVLSDPCVCPWRND